MARNLFSKCLLPAVLIVTTTTINAQQNPKTDQYLTAQRQEAFNIVHNTIGHTTVPPQQYQRKTRIAKIEIYPDYLAQYKAALAEHAKTAVQVETGVLSLQAVYNKNHPTIITVFEVYASEDAYQTHLKTPHFLKYKNGTLKMVKSLELVEVAPIAMEIKPELIRNKETGQ